VQRKPPWSLLLQANGPRDTTLICIRRDRFSLNRMRVRMKCLSLRKSASCPNSRKDEKPDCPLRRSLSLHSQDFTWANVKVSGLKQHVKWRFHLHIPVAQLRFCHTIIPFKIPSWNLGASVIRPGGGMLFATRMAAPRSAASSDSFATRSQRAIASPGPPQG